MLKGHVNLERGRIGVGDARQGEEYEYALGFLRMCEDKHCEAGVRVAQASLDLEARRKVGDTNMASCRGFWRNGNRVEILFRLGANLCLRPNFCSMRQEKKGKEHIYGWCLKHSTLRCLVGLFFPRSQGMGQWPFSLPSKTLTSQTRVLVDSIHEGHAIQLIREYHRPFGDVQARLQYNRHLWMQSQYMPFMIVRKESEVTEKAN